MPTVTKFAHALVFGAMVAGTAHAGDIMISQEEAAALVGDANTVFFFAGTDSAFEAGHIAGSAHAFSHDMQYLDDVQKCGGLPMCQSNAEAFLGAHGIGNDTRVIIYEDGKGVNESGMLFFLNLYGHHNAQMLEGGTVDWAGGLETGAGTAPAAKSFGATVDYSMIATMADVQAGINDDSVVILDARHDIGEYTGQNLKDGMKNAREHIGVASGGHIPSAIFSPWSKYAGNKSGESGKPIFRSVESIQKSINRLAKKGYSADSAVITYCHVGLGRGSFQYYGMKAAGHSNVRLYVGSFSEWGNSSNEVSTQ
jgi:thiosulfate/3-mercaptopyruvate sulfurtransferase